MSSVEWKRAWRKRNPEKVREYERNARLRNPERIRAKVRRAGWRFRGMPEPTRPEPMECESCGRPRGDKHLHADHDHTTGVFRGWICSPCNLGLGKLGDTIEGIEKILAYLKRARMNS